MILYLKIDYLIIVLLFQIENIMLMKPLNPLIYF